METRTSKTAAFRLVVACMVVALLSTTTSVPLLASAEETESIVGCLSSFMSVEGCVEAIDKAVHGKSVGDLEPACCEAIIKLGDNCWPLIFPNQPLVPLLLKAVCKLLGNVEGVRVAQAPYY